MTARRVIAYAAVVWAIIFGVPHLWWAAGVSWGFPGGQANFDRFMNDDWRLVYDGVVIVMCALAVAIVLTLQKPADQVARRKIPLALAWIACVILTFRGVFGAIFDGTSDLVWNPLFLIGGVLMGSVAWMARAPRANAPAASPH